MKLSIIIPVYNVEHYITKCLESVKAAIGTRDDVEVIVVDDGSPDRSIELALPILETMAYARLIHQENQGLSMARNHGLAEARGEYVWFVDSDDWLLPNATTDVLTAIKMNPHADVLATVLQMNYEGRKPLVKVEYKPSRLLLNGKDYLRCRYPQGASQRFILRKSFLKDNHLQFRKGLLHEDGLFGYIMLYLAHEVALLPEPVYAYRIRQQGSIMSSITMQTPKCMLLIHKLLMDFRKNKVAEEDQVWYREEIFKVLVNLFGFSKNLAFCREFAVFYHQHKHYFDEEATFMLQQGVLVSKARMIKYYPLALIRIKYVARKILRK